MQKVQDRFAVQVPELPDTIDTATYSKYMNTSFLSQSDQYLHRVGRAGRFGTKGLAISFISRPEVMTLLMTQHSISEKEKNIFQLFYVFSPKKKFFTTIEFYFLLFLN